MSKQQRRPAPAPKAPAAPAVAPSNGDALAQLLADAQKPRSILDVGLQMLPAAAKDAPKPTTLEKSYTNNLWRTFDYQPDETAKQAEDIAKFKAHYEANRERYDAVAEQSNVPAAVIAAMHWREADGSFGKYMHQGDPLGKPAKHVPRNIPVFHEWEPSAVDALGAKDKKRTQDKLGVTKDTTDRALLATYAEGYNGFGYTKRDLPSAYVWSGTSAYEKGKYTSDGSFDPDVKDAQVGVMRLVDEVLPKPDATAAGQFPAMWGGPLAGTWPSTLLGAASPAAAAPAAAPAPAPGAAPAVAPPEERRS